MDDIVETVILKARCMACKEWIDNEPHLGLNFINGYPSLCENNGRKLVELCNINDISPIWVEMKTI